jgi:tetratricopeptide (TPR) repeat protein
MNTQEKHFMNLLHNYVQDTACPYRNFDLGLFYENIGQTASAVSYYLRTAERTSEDVFRYEALIRAAGCFEKQGTRGLSVRGLLQRAIALLPKRPEAYFLLARFYEREKTVEAWVNCYTIASLGESLCDFDASPLRTSVNYPGKYGIIFEKAVSSWWVGLCEDSRDMFVDLIKNHPLDITHRQAVLNNLNFMKVFDKQRPHILYDKSKYKSLRHKFKNAESIEKNFSEAYQDMFILSLLDGKKNGTYLEIGAGSAFFGNNTALLEQTFDWKGISLDILDFSLSEFKNGSDFYPGLKRKNPCLKEDATKVDFDELMQKHSLGTIVDYLQLDCDPPATTLEILKRIPFNKYTFRVITFEHDGYRELHPTIKKEAEKHLKENGYVRVVSNIAPDDWRYYEDWWVHPKYVDKNILYKMIVDDEEVKSAENYMLSKI